MKRSTAATILLLTIMNSTHAQTESPASSCKPPIPLEPSDAAMVAPALDHYGQNTLQDDLWRRPDLSPRDRSIATLAILITHG